MQVIFKITLSLILLVAFQTAIVAQSRNGVKTIVIDPGHGQHNQGARGAITTEDDIVLAVGLKLSKAIKEKYPDIKVVLTRNSNTAPGGASTLHDALNNRAKIANESHGDLFISLHCNSNGRAPGGWYEKRVISKTPYYKTIKKKGKKIKVKDYKYKYERYWIENKTTGTETYIWAVGKNDEKVAALANTELEVTGEADSLYDMKLPDPNDPAEKARMLIYAKNYFVKSLNLAEKIQNAFGNSGRIDRGVKQRNQKGIWVLQATGMPSVLVELGFVTNKEEERFMYSDDGQDKIVDALMEGISSYIAQYGERKM